MELRITAFFNEAAPMDYSASVAELGNNAGRDTWNHALEDAKTPPGSLLLDDEEKREAFREFVKGSGGWSEEEIAAWSDDELTALCMQWIAGDMREVPDIELGPNMSDDDWSEYERMAQEGIVAGRIFRGIDGEVYFYIGS